ncbi:MAG TPA: nickel-binding protein [Burkholderiales bacterium]|nr:nickel-binding protein [Burkholderiales bacterium]
MQLYAIRRRSAWTDAKELKAVAEKSAHIGDSEMPDRVRWIRSYVIAELDGRLGTICIYEARDPAAIREHADKVGMPGDDIETIAETVVVREDPKPARAATA